jgi:hypothetical protein
MAILPDSAFLLKVSALNLNLKRWFDLDEFKIGPLRDLQSADSKQKLKVLLRTNKNPET